MPVGHGREILIFREMNQTKTRAVLLGKVAKRTNSSLDLIHKFQIFDRHAKSIFEFRVIVVLPSGRGVYLLRWLVISFPTWFFRLEFDHRP